VDVEDTFGKYSEYSITVMTLVSFFYCIVGLMQAI